MGNLPGTPRIGRGAGAKYGDPGDQGRHPRREIGHGITSGHVM